jgi:hypothetical protein
MLVIGGVIVALVVIVLVAVHVNRDEQLSIKAGFKWFFVEVSKTKSPPQTPVSAPVRALDSPDGSDDA